MLFVVRRLQELARRRRIPLYMCFVDLQKAYDSVDRELLWKVLARAGVPEEMIAVIRQFHDGMQAQVRMDDGGTLGLVRGYAGIETRMCAISATVQHFLGIGDRDRSCAFQRGRHDPKGSGVSRRRGWGGGGDTVRTCAEGGLGNALCRRRRRRIEIPRRVDENDDHYRGSVWGIWPDSVGEEDRDSLDAGAGETAEERGTAAQFRYLGGLVNEDGELTQEINHRSRAAWACIGRFSRELFDRPRAPWRLKVRLLRAEAMEALLYGCMTWAPRRDHYRLLRRTHHRLLLRVIGYRRERGTYRQLSYAQVLKKTGCQSMEATIRQRRLLFAGAMARQPAGRLPKRLMDGKLVGGEDPGKGRPEQNWMDCLKDDFQAFGATDGSTVDNRLTFGVDRAVWTLAAKMDDGAPWHKGVLKGAEKFMIAWHKEGEEASRRRATKRDFRDLAPPTHL